MILKMQKEESLIMKDKKLLKNIYYFLSIVCYMVSIIFIIKSNSTGMGILWLLLGSANLCFASVLNKKINNNDN